MRARQQMADFTAAKTASQRGGKRSARADTMREVIAKTPAARQRADKKRGVR